MSKKYYKKNKSDFDWLIQLPILVTIAFIPLVVRAKAILTPADHMLYADQEMTRILDVFVYNKGAVLIAMAIMALLILLFLIKTKKINLSDEAYVYFVYAYCGLVILSLLFSVDQSLSLIGYKERYENVFILIAYMILFVYSSKCLQTRENIENLMKFWIISIVILFIIGLSQQFDRDLVTSAIGTYLTIPAQYGGLSLKGDTEVVRNVYQTLYHYNYVSFYAAIGLPFFFVLSVLTKNWKLRLLYSALVVIFAINQVISLSRNGFIGIVLALVISAIFFRKQILKLWKVVLPVFVIFTLGIVFIASTSDSLAVQRVKQGFDSFFETTQKPLKGFTGEEGKLLVEHELYQFTVSYDTSNPHANKGYIFEENGVQVIPTQEIPGENRYFLNLSKDQTVEYAFTKSVHDEVFMDLTIQGTSWYFRYDGNEFLMLMPDQVAVPIPDVESFGFEGRENFATQRGYLWSRSIPLIKKYFFLGSGPDTFIKAYPQEDLVGKFNAYGNTMVIVDKPHNIYLDYAVQTGVPSLIALLLLWGYYLLQSTKLYIKSDFNSYYARIGLASMMATIGYLASGMFNDTNLSITPVFWIILGLGYASNRLYMKELKTIPRVSGKKK